MRIWPALSLRSGLLWGLVLLLVPWGWPAGASAQGFRAFNGRNHPELDWRVAETEHFEIVYPRRLTGIEAEAAPIAEASYEALAENLDVRPEKKIRIYLADVDEIANGFAVPFGGGYTQIWVHVNDFARIWTGREKWLRKVIAHEVAHLFHYRATDFDLNPLDGLLTAPPPSFFTEGLAQYETERWDAQRGDRWLRTAVLDDRLSYDDGRSLWNGRLRYAVGNSQVRYLATREGDSTLSKILAHRDTTLFGLLRTHDFDAAFEAVTDQSYRDFYDDWRRHVNVYYNTIAGQLPTLDSLRADSVATPLEVPGQYLYDLQPSPADSSKLAVLAVRSPVRPARRLYVVDRSAREAEAVAEGSINAPVSWHPSGKKLVFSRTTRGAHGALLNDLFVVGADGDGERRLTYSRRASSPAFRPDRPSQIAFVGAKGSTANLFLLNLKTGRETRLTDFTGDVQISALDWHPSGQKIAFARFTDDGVRDIAVLDLERKTLTSITAPGADNRIPVWSPDGRRLAYTTLRDDVPNVFVYDAENDAHRRVTNLATGATAYGWLPPDSAHTAGRLAIVSTESKARDRALLLDADHTAPSVAPEVPAGFAEWTTHRPPRTVASEIAPDASQVTRRRPYRPVQNINHLASLAVPYSLGEAFRVAGFTAWSEPLGKHTFFAAGDLAFGAPVEDSFLLASYVNNQLRPSLAASLYRTPGRAQSYGDDLLVEDVTGGDLAAIWPLDGFTRPYTRTRLAARLRYADITPLDPDALELAGTGLPPPESGQQLDLRLALERRRLRPYRHNLIHPLGGFGVRLELTGALPLLGADSQFLRGDLAGFGVLPGLTGLHRLYLYGRVQAQTGDPFGQHYLGLSRYDDVQLPLPGALPFTLGDAERVRGYRSYALGNRLLFGTAEYRVPLLPSLETEILGLVRLGATTAAAFVDGGLVWSGLDFDDAVERAGLGAELKNALHLGGALTIGHALGVAQPVTRLGTFEDEGDYDLYYRIRAAVPF